MDKKTKVDIEVRSIDGMRDRVWCTLGQKIQVQTYEPVEVSFGYATDREIGESLDDAARRVITGVRRYIKPLIKEVNDARVKLQNNH